MRHLCCYYYHQQKSVRISWLWWISPQQQQFDCSVDRYHHYFVTPQQQSRRTTTMLVLSEQNVRQCLHMKSCIDVNRQALISIVNGTSNIPTRLALPYIPSLSSSSSDNDHHHMAAATATDWTLFKPASSSLSIIHDDDSHLHMSIDSHHHTVSSSSSSTGIRSELSATTTTITATPTTHMGIKIVSVRNENPTKYQLPLVPATVLHIDPITGIVDAVVAGTYLTAARTAAGSALSYQYVRRNRQQQQQQQQQQQHDANTMNLHTVTIFGAGLQAETHLHALYTICHDQPISLLYIINRTRPRANELKQKAFDNGWIQRDDHCHIIELHDTEAVRKVVAESDCIITTTNTTKPLWDHAMPKNGCHIISVGSYTSDMQEIPSDVVQKSRIYLDTKEAIDVGDIKNSNLRLSSTSLSSSISTEDSHPVELLGKSLLVLSSQQQQQEQQQQQQQKEEKNDMMTPPQGPIYPYTFYKSVGTAIQDVLTVDVVVQRAKQLGIGSNVDMS